MSKPAASSFVRPFASDKDSEHVKRETKQAVAVFAATADSSLHHPTLIRISSYLYCLPYLTQSFPPDNTALAFVLDNGSGDVVGYCLAAPNTRKYFQLCREATFVASRKLIEPYRQEEETKWEKGEASPVLKVRELVADLENPEWLLMEEWPRLLEEYPAHLHVDLLPEYQRGGHGSRLINRMLDALREQRVPGVHLGMVANNPGVEYFYSKFGFGRFDEVMDGGLSGEKGRKAGDPGTLYLCLKL